ncbi:MAG: hypothetical protein JRJ84_11340 [Deltaproteobacteria bacterium]|nr:hypothetical protein [Deltaproteobacteria bacterium]
MRHIWLVIPLLVACNNPEDDTDDTDDLGPFAWWEGVTRDVATSPNGHASGVACHNCYAEEGDPATSLTNTLTALHAAQAEGADLLELDVKAEGAVWIIDHEDYGATSGALLEDVLADTMLQGGDQILFVEIKETSPTAADSESLLDLFLDAGFATEGRPLVFRAFGDNRIASVRQVRTYAEAEHADAALHIRYHQLYQSIEAFSVGGFHDLMDDAAGDDWHAVELSYATPDLAGILTYARSLGLGTAVWTYPVAKGGLYCGATRDLVDIVITESPLDECRDAITADNSILHLDVWDEDPATDFEGVSLESIGRGEAPFGTVLSFTGSESITRPADDVTTGVLITAVFRPADLDLATGTSVPIVSNDAVRLSLRGTANGTELVFGATIGGADHEAIAAPLRLTDTGSNFVIAAYDGSDMRLWLDVSETGVTPANGLSGTIDGLGSDWVIGSDPSGSAFFTGYIQFVSVQEL